MPGKKKKKKNAFADGNQRIRIRKKMLEFSSAVLPAPSPYHQDNAYLYYY